MPSGSARRGSSLSTRPRSSARNTRASPGHCGHPGVVFLSLVIISILAGLINNFADLAWVQNAFAGIQVCVCVLIFNATVKLLKKSVVDKPTAAIFLAVLVGSAVMDVPGVVHPRGRSAGYPAEELGGEGA